MNDKAFSIILGWLITIQHCLPFVNPTHNALAKQYERRILLDFYDFFTPSLL